MKTQNPTLESLTQDFLAASQTKQTNQIISIIKIIEKHYGIAAVRSLPTVKKGTWGESHS